MTLASNPVSPAHAARHSHVLHSHAGLSHGQDSSRFAQAETGDGTDFASMMEGQLVKGRDAVLPKAAAAAKNKMAQPPQPPAEDGPPDASPGEGQPADPTDSSTAKNPLPKLAVAANSEAAVPDPPRLPVHTKDRTPESRPKAPGKPSDLEAKRGLPGVGIMVNLPIVSSAPLPFAFSLRHPDPSPSEADGNGGAVSLGDPQSAGPARANNSSDLEELKPDAAFRARVVEQGAPAASEAHAYQSITPLTPALTPAVHAEADGAASAQQTSSGPVAARQLNAIATKASQGAAPHDDHSGNGKPDVNQSAADRMAGAASSSAYSRFEPDSHSAEAAGRQSSDAAPAADPRHGEALTPPPVRDLSVRLTTDSQQVDVKLIDRGGALHVTVKSGDPVLTSEIRASLHELSGGLEKNGFRADIWHSGSPARHATDATPAIARSTGEQQQQQSGGDPRRQGRNPYDPDHAAPKRTPGGAGANADWLNQMNALTGAEKER